MGSTWDFFRKIGFRVHRVDALFSVSFQTDSNGKRLKVMGSRGEDEDSKEVEASSGNGNMMAEQNAQPSEAQKQDYIHVRARRGQATDSHSLAERVTVAAPPFFFL